jgi:hypothetical protein
MTDAFTDPFTVKYYRHIILVKNSIHNFFSPSKENALGNTKEFDWFLMNKHTIFKSLQKMCSLT